MTRSDESSSFKSAEEQDVFEMARQCLQPGLLFRIVSHLYAERRLLIFLSMNFICMAIVWTHYGLIKGNRQKENVPEDDPYYWVFRILPPILFGSKHAILFQMALIPLTMARFSIAALSDSIVNRFVPMNHVLQIHTYLGYTIAFIVSLAAVLFVSLYGTLCAMGEKIYCKGLGSEIMLTGYAITGIIVLIAGTSAYRHQIPYELFYYVHHLVFVFYAVVVLHTFDNEQRNGTHGHERSQAFKWCTATFLYYICDRAAMRMNHRYKTTILSSSTVSSPSGSKAVLLKIRRPVLFRFKPGQYAFLRLKHIDRQWHPFSMASGPESHYLEFYIEVFEDNSWTGMLWKLLDDNALKNTSHLQFEVELQGPYGSSLGKTEDYSHALAIGTGTGIVPILSLLKQHVSKLVRLDPVAFNKGVRDQQRSVRRFEQAKARRKGSLASKILTSCFFDRKTNIHRRDELKRDIAASMELHLEMSSRGFSGNKEEMKIAAFQATRSIYGVILLSILPVVGVSAIALTISWNTVPIPKLYNGMSEILEAITLLFQAFFAMVAFFIWDGSEFLAYIDMVFTVVAPFADWYWFLKYDERGVLKPVEITLYCLLMGYMTIRVWSMAVRPRHHTWEVLSQDKSILERVHVVWVARSASLVSRILPDLNEIYASLVHRWGEENAAAVCDIDIYVTDKDLNAVQELQHIIEDKGLLLAKRVQFGRSDLAKVIEQHTLQCIATTRNSYSLLAFCGSPELAGVLHQYKISNDMVTNMTGNRHHQMEFVAESYGGSKKKKSDPAKKSESTTAASEVSSHSGAQGNSKQSVMSEQTETEKEVSTNAEDVWC